MIGLIVRCEDCETDRPDTVYYVGENSTHCGECWSAIVAAQPNFNLDVVDAKIDAELKAKREAEDTIEFQSVEDSIPDTIKVNPQTPLDVKPLHQVPINELHRHFEVHFNTGSSL